MTALSPSADVVDATYDETIGYVVFADLLGDGVVDLADAKAIRLRNGTTLPPLGIARSEPLSSRRNEIRTSYSQTEEILMTILEVHPRSTTPADAYSVGLVTVAIRNATFATPSRAAPIVSVQPVTVNAGSTGDALDVTLTNTGSTPTVPIAGFSFEINVTEYRRSLSPQSTPAPPRQPTFFGSNSTFGPDITIPVSSLESGSAMTCTRSPPPRGISVGANSTVGLGHVFFNVSSTASGMIPVTLFGLNTVTNLAGLCDFHACLD